MEASSICLYKYINYFNSVAVDTEIKSQLTYNKVNKRTVLLVISIEF